MVSLFRMFSFYQWRVLSALESHLIKQWNSKVGIGRWFSEIVCRNCGLARNKSWKNSHILLFYAPQCKNAPLRDSQPYHLVMSWWQLIT